MSWTDERVATLSKLWADGLSASQIANILGGVTRNAVIGKVHRLGLSGRARATNNSSVKRTKRVAGTSQSFNQPRRQPSAGNSASSAKVTRLKPVVEVPDLVAPESKRLSLTDLNDRVCKWPHGDPATNDFHFCGHKCAEGKPYCEYHAQLAFQPMPDRKRKTAQSQPIAIPQKIVVNG